MSAKPNWATTGRDWPNRATSRFVEAAGMTWHVQVAGDGPVALLLHGTGAATHSWRALLPLLAQHLTVLAPDMPGHGFTELPSSRRMSLPGMAGAIGDLLLQMKMQPVLAVGHSAGAAIAIRMALDRAIMPQALVGLNAALLPFRGVAAQIFPPLAKLLTANPFVPALVAWTASDRARVKNLIEGTGSRIDAAGLDYYARLIATRRHADAALRMMANWDLDPLYRDLPTLAIPLLLIEGDRDRAIPPGDAAKVKARRPETVVRTFPGGHLLHEELPAVVDKAILDFARETGVLPQSG